MPRLVILSDTHNRHDLITVPHGDILVHCGDFTGLGEMPELLRFSGWFHELPHTHKVLIAGNHDRLLEKDFGLGSRLFWKKDEHYLLDSGVELMGLLFWGSPWQPEFNSWAFNLRRGEELRHKWSLIPEGTDVLMTHGPPLGIRDELKCGNVGCADMWDALNRVKPRLHCFGHIHEGYGVTRGAPTTFVNAAICDGAYRPNRKPIVLDLEDGRIEVVD